MFLTDTIAVTFTGSPILSITRRITVVVVSFTTNSVCPVNFTSVSPEIKLIISDKRSITSKQTEGIPETKEGKSEMGA